MPTLPLQDNHTITYTTHGNPDGPTILSFHGGPGSHSKLKHAQIFNLSKYHVILFDQRGCGQSTPLGEINHNTTQDLLNDAERLRQHLNIDQWFIAGGSWGSTLALLYAQQYPKQVKGLLLSAIFLADISTMNWSFDTDQGVAQLMPDVFQTRQTFFNKFNVTPQTTPSQLLNLLQTSDLPTQQEIAAGIYNWEGNLFSPQSSISYKSPGDIDETDIASVKIFLHYQTNNWFISPNQILNNLETIKHIPTVIVHGRYDILCPLTYAHKLHNSLTNSQLIIPTSSGHSLTPEGTQLKQLAFSHFLENHS